MTRPKRAGATRKTSSVGTVAGVGKTAGAKTATTKASGRTAVDTELVECMATFARKVQRSSAARVVPLSAARYAILQTLHDNGQLRMGTVASCVGIAARTLTPMADALEHDGYLRRLEDPADRRAQLLKITESGNAALRQSRTVRTTAVAELFSGLREAERKTLRNLLRKIIASDE